MIFDTTGYLVTGNTLTLAGSTPTLTANAGVTGTISSIIAGSAGLTKSGAGTVVLTGANTYTGGNTISTGTLQVNSTSSLQGSASIASGATLWLNQDGVTWGNSLTGSGTATLYMSTAGATSYASGLSGFAGTFRLANSGSTDSKFRFDSSVTASSMTLLLDPGSTMYLPFGGTQTFGAIRMSGTGNSENRGAIRNEGNGTVAGPITLLGDTSLTGGGSFTGSITAGVSGTSALILGTSNQSSSSTFSGNISDSTGAVGITVAFGSPTLSGSNSYSGPTTINSGATLRAGGVNALPSGAGRGNVTVAGTLDMNGRSISAAGLTGGGTATSGAAGTLTLSVGSNDVSGTFSGVVQNGSATVLLTKVGAGTLTLTGANTYTGATTVSQGTLQVGNGGTAGSLASSVIMNNANLVYSFSGAGTASLPTGSLTGSGNLSGTAGFITLNGSITQGGAISFVQNADTTLYNGISLTGANTITGSSITINADIGKQDSDGNSLSLDTSAVNGPMSLSFSLGRSGRFYVPTSFTANSGTGTITVPGSGPASNGWRDTPVTLTGRMNVTAGVSSNVGVTLNENTTTGTVSGAFSGGMSLTKGGTGTLTVSSVQNFTGSLSVNAGTYVAAVATSSGNASALGGGGNSIVVNSGGSLVMSGNRGAGFHTGSATINGGTIVGDGSDLSFVSGNTLTFATSSGTFSGTGQWLRRNANNKVAVASAASGSVISINDLYLLDSNPQFEVADGAQAADLTISGSLTGGSTFVKSGAGTVRLTRVNSSYTGQFQIDAGTIDAAAATTGNQSALGNGSNSIVVNSGGRLLFSVSRAAGYQSGAVTINGGTVTFDSSDNSFAAGSTMTLNTAAATINGTGQWRYRGGATLQVNAAANGSTISVATLDLYDGTETFNVASGAMLTISSALTNDGGGSLSKTNSGTLRLTGDSSGFTGQAQVRGGTLELAGGRFGTGSGVGNQGAINIGISAGENGTFTVTGGTIAQSGGAGMRVADLGTGTFNQSGGSVTLSSGGLWVGDGAGSTGTVNLSGGYFTSTLASTVLATRSIATLNVSGSGDVTLATLQLGHPIATGQTATVNLDGGRLAVNDVTRVNATGNFYFNSGTLAARGSSGSFMTGLSGAEIKAGGAVIDSGAFEITIGQSLAANGGSPGGGLRKLGSGTLTLSAANTYTGNTTVQEGVLKLGAAGSIASGTIRVGTAAGSTAALDVTAAGLTVFDGQTLGGHGRVDGNVLFAPGSIVAPGGSVGVLDVVGTVTWSGSSGEVFDMANMLTGTAGINGWDLLTTGSLSITASAADPFKIFLTSLADPNDDSPGPMSALEWDPDASGKWVFVDAENPITLPVGAWYAFDDQSFDNTITGGFSVVRGDAIGGSDTDLWIVYAAVPEPGTLALAGIGLAAAALALRRGVRRAAP